MKCQIANQLIDWLWICYLGHRPNAHIWIPHLCMQLHRYTYIHTHIYAYTCTSKYSYIHTSYVYACIQTQPLAAYTTLHSYIPAHTHIYTHHIASYCSDTNNSYCSDTNNSYAFYVYNLSMQTYASSTCYMHL